MPTGVSPSAKSSRMTGTTLCSWRSASNCSKVVVSLIATEPGHRIERVDVEAAPGARVAGRTDLVDGDEDRVSITVERGTPNILHVTRGVSLAPVLLAGATPERDPTLGQGSAQSLCIHPPQHQYLEAVVLLDDRGQQPVGIEDRAIKDGLQRRIIHHLYLTSIPAAASPRLTSATVMSPSWNTDAASTASAPDAIAGAKCSTAPAPPLAITGTELSSRIAAMSSRSKPLRVPSASMEFTSSSPTPRSIASAAQSRAFSAVSVRPPWVVTTKEPADRLTSSES